MLNFTYFNPVKIVFGKGSIAELPKVLPSPKKVMMVYGGGSIKRNGVYDQVISGLKGVEFIEFSGIEPNPEYETCMKAVDLARREKVDFVLGVGGGSVADAAKFIALAIPFEGKEPWDILLGDPLKTALPVGVIITLPATGSEMNNKGVISYRARDRKLSFTNDLAYPLFSILDPEVTFSLPTRQTINGIVDAFIHTTEQYLTYPVNSPLQDRQAEAILLTLIEEGPKVLANPKDYDARANIMWAATNALNGLIGCGAPGDWASHAIGHELTALFGVDHGQSLGVVMPALLKYLKEAKKAKLAQYGRRVWGLSGSNDDALADQAISRTIAFFEEIGMPTRLSAYGIARESYGKVAESLGKRERQFGEHMNIGPQEVPAILALAE